MNQLDVTQEKIVDFILSKVALRTNTPVDQLSGDTLLADVGVDSLNAVMICGYLEDEYELEIEPMIMFQHKTANHVANAVSDMLAEK